MRFISFSYYFVYFIIIKYILLFLILRITNDGN